MEQKHIINTVLGILAVLFFGVAIYLTVREKPKTTPSPAAPVTASNQDTPSNSSNPQTETRLYPPNDSNSISGQYTSAIPAPDDMNVARASLIQYFNFLSTRQYSLAVPYHGAGWKVLQFRNPEVNFYDLSTLLADGCEKNGWHCLQIKNAVMVNQISPVKYEYTVEFESPIAGRNSFEFFVQKVGPSFLVLTPPVI